MNIKRQLLALLTAALAIAAWAQHRPSITAEITGTRADTITLASRLVNPPIKATVIYPLSADTTQRYPVVYLLNGYGGDYRSWPQSQPRIHDMARERGIIFVCPDGRDSWYWDSPVDPNLQMESLITRVLVPLVDKAYPTLADAPHRAITGLSMGGHGALWLAMRHPDLFGSMGSMSGGVNIIPFTKRWKMAQSLGAYEENPKRWESHTVINLVDSLAAGQNITFDCGIDDFFSDVNAQLHQALIKKGIPHDYTSRPGRHSWDYWRNSLLHHVVFFDEAFRRADSTAK